MAFLQVSAPKSTLNLAGHIGDTAIAYGDGDTITYGGGNTIYLVGPNQTFLSENQFARQHEIGAGNDQVAVYGDGDIAKVSGDTVTTYGHGDTVNITGYHIADYPSSLGSTSVVAEGDSSVFVTGDGASVSFLGGTGFSVILGGTADHTNVNLGQGGGVAVGGEEEVDYRPHTQFYGQNTLVAGLKQSTLYGSNHGSNNLVASGSAGDGLVGGENSYNLMDGRNSTGNDFMEGHQGLYTAPIGVFNTGTPSPTNIFLAGSGNDTLVAGSGYNEIHAGSGADLIAVFNNVANQVAGGNNIMVDSFKPGIDHIDLIGYGGSTADLLAGAGHANGGTQFNLSDGAHVNVASVNLTANDIYRQG